MENTGNSPGDTMERSAQVCDGCRKRKVKCDGKLPACSNCARLQTTCTFSVQLQRKTKRRGHTDPKDETIQRLQIELAELRRQIQQHKDPSSAASTESQQGSSLPRASQAQIQTAASLAATSKLRGKGTRNETGPVLRHLGRLVSAADGVDQFAGSTTGVHFALTAQQKYQELFNSSENFPEIIFSLHLLSSSSNEGEVIPHAVRVSDTPYRKEWFPMHKQHYMNRIELFFERWASIYPIFPQKQFIASMNKTLNRISYEEQIEEEKIALYQLYLILAITGSRNSDDDKSAEFYYSCSIKLQYEVTSEGNLASLQSLLLLLIFLQQSTRHYLVIQTIGTLVRLAQSLGLHRHPQRFKFCIGEMEIRKRIWWCVYSFDVMISLYYGLPKVIQDEDDDNDLPVDCDFDDITVTKLPLPLPGEPTIFAPFLAYLGLSKILSTALKELYTTTRRRNAVDKMAALDRELRMWLALAEPTIGVFQHLDERQEDAHNRDFSSLWLHLLYQLALIYVHRPALTFEPTEPKFKDSLELCSEAASAAIRLLSSSPPEAQLFQIFPIGPSIIFHCGLLNIFFVWCLQSTPLGFENSVENAASLIEHLEATRFHELSVHEKRAIGGVSSLSHTAWVLRHLSIITLKLPTLALNSPTSYTSWTRSPDLSASATTGLEHDLSSQVQRVPSAIQEFPQGYHERSILLDPGFSLGHGGGIDYLNQMDDSFWNFLPPVDDMMEDVDLDVNSFHSFIPRTDG